MTMLRFLRRQIDPVFYHVRRTHYGRSRGARRSPADSSQGYSREQLHSSGAGSLLVDLSGGDYLPGNRL